MRHTRAHTGNRRSHHALSKPPISIDKETGAMSLRHRASATNATYRGRIVVAIEKKLARKARRVAKKAEGK
ncbi:MAG TPA: 50S ribosomal protein L32 [Candidatus Paceibacterota bacterium]